jgi:hypothetical protein
MRSLATPKQLNTSRIADPNVAAVFAVYPPVVRKRLMELRKLIISTADSTPGVGVLQETLKWGEPAYLTAITRSGSTIRIHSKRGGDTKYAIYFNCNTNLVDSFRTLFPTSFRYFGNRELEFDISEEIPSELSICLAMALTYHLRKQ